MLLHKRGSRFSLVLKALLGVRGLLKILGALSLASLTLLGCIASITRVDTVTLQYRPAPYLGPALPGPKQSVQVSVIDQRENSGGWLGGKLGKLQVGTAENAFGESIAPAIALSAPLETTFTKAFQEELTARGFQVQNNAPLKVQVTISHFYTQFKNHHLGYLAHTDLTMHVSAMDPKGKILFSTLVATQGQSEYSFWQEGSIAQTSLNQAFSRGMTTLFSNDLFLQALLTAH